MTQSNSPFNYRESLQLTAKNFGIAVYEWHGPSNFYSNERTPEILHAKGNVAGVYSVTATLGKYTSSTAAVMVTTVTVFTTCTPPINQCTFTGGLFHIAFTAITVDPDSNNNYILSAYCQFGEIHRL